MTSLSHPGILSTTPARTGDAERRRGRWVMVVRWGLLDLAFWSAVTFLFAGQYWLLSGLYGARAPFGATFADQIQMWAPCAVLAPAVAWLAIRAGRPAGPARSGQQLVPCHRHRGVVADDDVVAARRERAEPTAARRWRVFARCSV